MGMVLGACLTGLVTSYGSCRKVDGWKSVRREGSVVSVVPAGGGYGKSAAMPHDFWAC